MAGLYGEEQVKQEEKVKAPNDVKNSEEQEEVVAKVEELKVNDEPEDKEQKLQTKEGDGRGSKVQEEEVKMEVEAKTGVAFPVKLPDGKQLNSVGIRKKKILALGVNVYAFGIYADNAKLKETLKTKFAKAPEKPTKVLYDAVIDADVEMLVRLVIVFGGLTMSMVRKNFDEGLGASLKKLNGGRKNEELVNKVMGAAKDTIKLSAGSIIEITRMPGNVLRTKIKEEIITEVESELLCRAYFHVYLGDDPFDKEAKEKFGASMLTLL